MSWLSDAADAHAAEAAYDARMAAERDLAEEAELVALDSDHRPIPLQGDEAAAGDGAGPVEHDARPGNGKEIE